MENHIVKDPVMTIPIVNQPLQWGFPKNQKDCILMKEKWMCAKEKYRKISKIFMQERNHKFTKGHGLLEVAILELDRAYADLFIPVSLFHDNFRDLKNWEGKNRQNTFQGLRWHGFKGFGRTRQCLEESSRTCQFCTI